MTIQTLFQNILPRQRAAYAQVNLRPRQAARLGARPMRIQVLSGIVWITREGSPDDAVLSAGDTFHSCPGGMVVAQAITPARVEIFDD